MARGLENDKVRYQRLITQWVHGVTAISDLSVGVCNRDVFRLRHRCSRLGRCSVSVSAASNSTALLSIARSWRTHALGAVILYRPLAVDKPILDSVVLDACGWPDAVQGGGYSSPEQDGAVHESTGDYENRRSSTTMSCIRSI